MNPKFLEPYKPGDIEKNIYKKWEESGLFNPDNCVKQGYADKDAEPFTIIMPPTNANGSLHAGHALVMTIEDIITRYKRMQGYKTLWLPGLDHAGFETQVVFEKKLEKEGRSRFDIPREDLYKEILEFTLSNSNNIRSQVRSIGSSCDWSREKFTLDEDIVKVVYKTFADLEKDSLLYRGKRIVNWCPKHQTSFSDLEIKDEEKIDTFYYLKYGPFTIATARPETKFGDKYVVMHPNDNRYKNYLHGQKIELEWINGPITATVIKDESIDMEFGTGAMTITPWHDPVDFDIAEKHNLDKEQIIDERGKLMAIAGEFAGMSISKARPLIIEKLKSKGLVEKTDENYKHVVKTCYKCGTTIEPQIKAQWFVKMKPLAQKALEKIRSQEVTYIPEHYEKITTHWLENIIDWNISRQIVWGIPIPAKICKKCGHGMVDLENKINRCNKCGGEVEKDSDTFDTWFSSSQWPFATLMTTGKDDFNTYYPTSLMETAGEIIFFWVSRMIMMSLYRTGEIPFKKVYLHGLVLDAKGQKMSKSRGNVINPLDITSQFGTDALRIGLVVGNTPGTSLALSQDKIKGYKNFANKIWNIARFVLTNIEDFEYKAEKKIGDPDIEEMEKEFKLATEELDNYRIHNASERIYHYVWHTFADKVIEESKSTLFNESASEDEKNKVKWKLYHILETSLRMLHPFMPFVTEEIWQSLPHKKERPLLMVERWPITKS